jgi:hypothetical protein
MSSWKDLYSEVKKRKMEALDKKDVVKAVEMSLRTAKKGDRSHVCCKAYNY